MRNMTIVVAVVVVLILVLTGCGVDGPPQRPVEQQMGVSVSGDARVGVSARL